MISETEFPISFIYFSYSHSFCLSSSVITDGLLYASYIIDYKTSLDFYCKNIKCYAKRETILVIFS